MATENIDIRISDNGGARRVSRDITGIGTSASGALTAVKLLAAGLAGLAIFKVTKAAIQLESAMVGVQKTTGLTDIQITKLAGNFQKLSQSIPLSATELGKIGEVAGQLGITGVKNITVFTETVAKVASTTDFTVESASADLARLSKVFKLPIQEVNRLASSLNALENTTTANAPTIAEFSKRMAGAAKTIGLTAAQVNAVGATLDQLGARAEAGSSVMIRVFGAMIAKADEFGAIMGTTTDEFRARLEQDAIGTVTQFLEALGALGKTEAVAALDDLGLAGVRALPIMLQLKDNAALLTTNVNTSTKAFREGTSIQDEFATQVRSTENQLKLLGNESEIIQQRIGAGLLPAVRQIIGIFKNWLSELNKNEFRLRNIGAFIGGTMIDVLKLGRDAFNAIRAAMETVAAIALKVTANLGQLLIPFAKLKDLISGNTKATEALKINLEAMNSAGDGLLDTASDRVKDFQTGVKNANIEVETTLKNFKEANAEQDKLLAKKTTVPTATGPKLDADTLEDIVDAGALAGTELFIFQLEQIDLALAKNKISAEQASRAIQEFSSNNLGPDDNPFQDIVDAGAITGTDLFIKQLERIQEGFIDGKIGADEASRAIQAFSSGNQGAAEEVQGLAAVLKAAETPLDRLNKKLETVVDLFERGFIDDTQAANAVRRFTDTYNSEMDRLKEKTDQATKDIQDAIKNLANSMESRMSDTFLDIIKGTNSLKDNFVSLMDEIIRQVLRLTVVKPIIDGLFGSSGSGGLLGGFLTGLFTGGTGGAAAGAASGLVSDLPIAPSFASGGEFRVGGIGGTDSQRVSLNATPGEIVRITTPSQERVMSQSGISNVSVVVNIAGGQEETSSSGDTESQEFGLQAANVIKSVVLDMMRPGGPLAGVRQDNTRRR